MLTPPITCTFEYLAVVATFNYMSHYLNKSLYCLGKMGLKGVNEKRLESYGPFPVPAPSKKVNTKR